MRAFRDRDYLRTEEGLLFTVVGNVHPADRVISYLKYVPSAEGEWGEKSNRYRRAMRQYTMPVVRETLNTLKEAYPDYIFHSGVLGFSFSAVPIERIEEHYRPEDCLAELAKRQSLDKLQRKAVDLAKELSEESGLDLGLFGVTGSVLVDIHSARLSDIDLIVYGRKNVVCVKEALQSMKGDPAREISSFDEKKVREWCNSTVRLYPVDVSTAKIILGRKWGRGQFRGTLFSIHPVKVEDEVGEKYGDRVFAFLKMVGAKATVTDSSDAMFMPAVYKVNDVQLEGDLALPDVREVVSFEGLYADIASEGERITVNGKLERVEDRRSAETYCRIVVGSTEAGGLDYIRPQP